MDTLTDPGSWLDPRFWADIMHRTVAWALEALPKVLVVFVLAWAMLKLLNLGCKKLQQRAEAHGDDLQAHVAAEQRKRTETLISIVKKAGSVAIWAFVVVLILTQVGVDVAPLIAGAGVLGLAIGFGAQELVRDVISGFFILLENQLRTGDVAIINGTGGLVEAMGLRTIVLRDLSGVVHVFQNGKIDTLSNMTKTWSAMVFDVGVAYKEDTDEVGKIMLEVAEELRADPEFGPKILEPMELFGVDAFGDSAVVVKARLKTQPIEQWSVGREYRRRLKYAFDERGIEIPFPHQTLYFGEASPPFQIAGSPSRSGNGVPNKAAPAPQA